MAIMLPGWLGEALNYLGFNWPLTNEDALRAWAGEFRAMAGDADLLQTRINEAIQHVQSHNDGPAVDAFVSRARGGDSNVDAAAGFAHACDIAAGVCGVCADIVVVLKGVFIVQLGILAASLASGPGVLLVREGVRRAVNAGINVAAEQVMNEVL